MAAALIPPAMPNQERAAELLQNLGAIWDAAELSERRQSVHTLLEAVYLDSGARGPIAAIQPRTQFARLFGLVARVGAENRSAPADMTPCGESITVVAANSICFGGKPVAPAAKATGW